VIVMHGRHAQMLRRGLEESPLIGRKVKSTGQPLYGVVVRPVFDAALEIADGARTQACPLRQLVLRQAGC
jgi:hypothetical protein